MADAPGVSVIVVSRDRARELAGSLDALEAQRLARGSFEIVVVDDASSDHTWAMLTARWRSAAGEWLPGRVALQNRRPLGPGRSRNLAVDRARGAIVAFTDSDCEPAVGWLEELIAPFAASSVGAVGGCEIDEPTEPPLARAAHFVMTGALTTGRVRGGSGRAAARYRPRSFSMAVRRAAFLRAGGFSDMYYGEDIDLSLRVARLGFDTVFAPRSRVHHRRRRSLRGIAQQAFAMGRGRARLMRSDRGHVEAVYALPALVLLGAAALSILVALAPASRAVGLAALFAAAAYLAAVGWQAQRAAAALYVGLLAPLVFATQQVAYGLGFLAGMAQRARPESFRCSAR